MQLNRVELQQVWDAIDAALDYIKCEYGKKGYPDCRPCERFDWCAYRQARDAKTVVRRVLGNV